MFAQPHTSAAADIYNLTISQKPQTDKAKTPVFLFLRLTLPKLRRRIFKDAKFTPTRGYFINKWSLIKLYDTPYETPRAYPKLVSQIKV